MSKELKDGGPAFPCSTPEYMEPIRGISMRDYFAAKALPKLLDMVPKGSGIGVSFPDHNMGVAKAAYAVADAMLAAREGEV